jgi:hypothetical protein
MAGACLQHDCCTGQPANEAGNTVLQRLLLGQQDQLLCCCCCCQAHHGMPVLRSSMLFTLLIAPFTQLLAKNRARTRLPLLLLLLLPRRSW